MRTPWSREAWEAEQRFVLSINPEYPPVEFGYGVGCFARYCNMQARFADEDGFPDIAASIREHELKAYEVEWRDES